MTGAKFDSAPHVIQPSSEWSTISRGGCALSTYSKVWHASGGLAWPGARADDPSVVDRRSAAGVGGGEPASHRAGGVAGTHGLAGGPRLLRPADRHDPCLPGPRGAAPAAPVRPAGG